VRLTAVDPDTTQLGLNITTLPLLGSLYQAGADLKAASSTPMTLGERVMHSGGYVVYVPLVNAEGMGYDAFGYKAFDEGDRLESSAEAVVTVDVPWKGPVKPVAGEAGYALYFDGMNDFADFGKVMALGTDLNSVSVELWIKTNALVEVMDVTLMHGGPFQLRWSKAQGFLAQVGDTVAASGRYFNDGNWHYVAATWDGAVASLVVDGVVEATAEGPALGWEALAMDPSIIVGLDPAVGSDSAYKGLVDGVAVWSSPRTGEQMLADASTDLTQANTMGLQAAPATPVTLFKLNEACGAEFTESITGRVVPGRGSDEATAPALVPSTAPFTMSAVGVEETALTIQLPTSAETCEESYPVCVLRAPENGVLSSVEGMQLTQFPVTVLGGAVVYTGELGAHGDSVDELSYMAGDCALLELEPCHLIGHGH
jgi:hypothetical protein